MDELQVEVPPAPLLPHPGLRNGGGCHCVLLCARFTFSTLIGPEKKNLRAQPMCVQVAWATSNFGGAREHLGSV